MESTQPAYAIEADHVAAHIEQRQSPAMSWDDSLGNMKTLDRWRKSIGLIYESEKPEVAPANAIVTARGILLTVP